MDSNSNFSITKEGYEPKNDIISLVFIIKRYIEQKFDKLFYVNNKQKYKKNI